MTTITWTCPVCNKDTKVDCYPPVEARTYGDPLDCYPGEDAYIDPDECHHCDTPLDIDTILEQASEKDAADEEYYESLKEDEED